MTLLSRTSFTVVSVKTLNDSQPNQPIVEVGCVRMLGLKIAEAFSLQINPETDLPEEFTRQTGIYSTQLRDKPTMEEALPMIAGFINRDVIIWTAHPKKLSALHKTLRLTQSREKEIFLSQLAEAALPEVGKTSLNDLVAHFNLDDQSPVRAEAMAMRGAQAFTRLMQLLDDNGSIDMPELLAICAKHKPARTRRSKELPFDSDRLRDYPTLPGVYFMKNRLGEILYVGKAKNLRNRLRSYFQKQSRLPTKVAAMMKQVAMIDVITVGSELEALLLEARLIKHHQPFFNKKVKHFQHMAFMRITLGDEAPMVTSALETDDPDSAYFGPFPGKSGLEYHLETLNRVFRLRSCSKGEFEKHRESPCMKYRMELCSGPCAGMISQKEYRADVEDFMAYLTGESSRTVESLVARRDAYIEELLFERAAVVQEQLEKLERLQIRSYEFFEAVEARHCILVLPDVQPGAVRLLCVLRGQPLEWQTFDPHRDGPVGLKHIVELFLAQMNAMEETDQPFSMPKELFEEARLLSDWLAVNEDQAVYIAGRTTDEVLADLRIVMAESVEETDAPEDLSEEEWEREWALA